MSEFISTQCDGGTMKSYLARPEKPNGAGIVLASSIWGINTDLISMADYFAALGYQTIIPNLFWRLTEAHGIDYDFTKLDHVMTLMKASNDPDGLKDLNKALAVLKERTHCGKTGVIGWCYGGRLACLLATEEKFDAAVGIYPTYLETRLDIVPHIRRNLSLHLSGIEQWSTAEDAVEQIQHAFAPLKLVEAYRYSGLKHGFDFGPPHPNFDHPAARLCDSRVALYVKRLLCSS